MRCQKTILQIGSFAMLLSYLFTMAQIIRSALKEDDSRLVPLKHDFVVNSPSPNLSTTQVLNATDPSWNAADGIQNKTSPPQFVPKIYQIGPWDLAPIVITEYKLLFFTQGKVACTEFKKLLRRMMHLKDWDIHQEPKIPHDPKFNGLKYLYHYPLPEALHMLTDPEWMRAIFVRDPKERFLSAFLDKAVKKKGMYIDRHCCISDQNKEDSCGKQASRSLIDFIQVVRQQCCCDPHWKPQSQRIDDNLWDYINFIGYFHNMAADTQKMLQDLGMGAWEAFGASGWGKFQNESIFVESSQAKHRTSARTKLLHYFNDTISEGLIEDFYADDYNRFEFDRHPLFKPET